MSNFKSNDIGESMILLNMTDEEFYYDSVNPSKNFLTENPSPSIATSIKMVAKTAYCATWPFVAIAGFD